MSSTSQAWVPGQTLTSADANSWFIAKRGIKASATARTSTSTSADPDLQVSLASGQWYVIEAAVYYSAPSPSFPWTFTLPGGWTFWYTALYYNSSNALVLESHAGTDANSASTVQTSVSIDGLVNTLGGSGTLAFSWGASTGGSTSVNAYSCLAATRVG